MENRIVVAVKGLIVNKGKALIVRRSDNDQVGAGSWECVGGKIEFGEGLEAALIREVKEEVGIEIEVKKLLYATTFKTDSARQVVVLTYLCGPKNLDVMLSEEHTEYLWADKDQLMNLLYSGIIEDFEKNNVFQLEEFL